MLPIVSALASLMLSTSSVPNETQIEFEARSGETVEAFQGTISVPEHRSAENSREITLHYVRFPATGDKKGAPIVYLAGGPGGSGIGTAKRQRFPLFMAMREFGDVIAFDQRGTGASNDMPPCRSDQKLADAEPHTEEEYVQAHRLAVADCLSFWGERNIDIHGYTTKESVADLDDLRQHLGAKKISLWGTSYGSHLAFAAMKTMDKRLHKVVISSAEGLDQTVKLPARTDAMVERLQAAINTQDAAAQIFPDIEALIRRVLKKVEEAPLLVPVPQRDGTTVDVLVHRWHLQEMSSAMIGDTENAKRLLWIYLGLDNGDVSGLARVLSFFYEPDTPISFRPMSLAMDVASGISAERLALVETQAPTSLFADYLNAPMPQILGTIDGIDLGEEFRVDPKSKVPTLLLSGTLDGRTYVESQHEAVSGLKRVSKVIVKNAGHNLFMSSPDVTATIQDFMRGEDVDGRVIDVPLPDFSSPQ